MSPGVQITLSGILTFGVPLALAAHELIAMRRRGGGGYWPGGAPARPRPPLSWQPSMPPIGPATSRPESERAERRPELV